MSNITYKEIVDYLKETTGDYNWYLNNKIGLPVAHRLMRPNLVQQHVTEAAKKLKKMKDEEHAGQLAHAARQSAKAGKTHFTLGGKTFPVTAKLKEENPPFEGGHKATTHKDQYGNVVKNVARHLARKAMRDQEAKKQKNEEFEQVDERHMTDKEKDYREYLVKKMKGKGWEKRYPGRGKEVMYATATKMAMKEEASVKEKYTHFAHFAPKPGSTGSGDHISIPVNPAPDRDHMKKFKRIFGKTIADKYELIRVYPKHEIKEDSEEINMNEDPRLKSLKFVAKHFSSMGKKRAEIEKKRQQSKASFDNMFGGSNPAKDLSVKKEETMYEEEKKYIPKVGDYIATDIPLIHGRITKVTPSLVHFKHPNGKEYTADHSAVGPVRKNKSMYEETINMYEDSAAERDHTHAAHFHDHKGNWSGMALITAMSDDDAVKQAHKLAQSDRYKDFKLAHVEKHTPVKDLDESVLIESQEQLDEILSEDKAERAAKSREIGIANIKKGVGSVAARKRLAARLGVHHITGEPLSSGGGETSKHDDDDYYIYPKGISGSKIPASEVEKLKKSFKRRKITTAAALAMIHAQRKADTMKHGTGSSVGGGGTGPANVSPLQRAMTKISDKPSKGAGASPAELDAAKAEKKAAEKKKTRDSSVKRLTGKLDEAKTKKEELNTNMIDNHQNDKKDKVKKVLQKALQKRKYLGMKKGRTATNERAHKIDVDPKIEDAKT
jgi:hypothetical protein